MAGLGAAPRKRPRLLDDGPAVPVIDRDDYLARMRALTQPMVEIKAMYNSLVGGIVTDPALMSIPISDHAIVRGHAIFDTCSVCDGRLYRADIHLDRHLDSAEKARIPLPFGAGREENKQRMRSIIGQTVVASGCRNCSVRYYLSAGPGTFGVTPAGCTPAWYVVVYPVTRSRSAGDLKGVSEYTVDVPMKPAFLATIKCNNYLLNVLTCMASQDRGGRLGILVEDGFVAESCVMGCLFVTRENRLVTPPCHNILNSTTVRKILQLAPQLVDGGVVAEASQEPVPVATARDSREMFLVGGDCSLVPVTHWDGRPVGAGVVGEATKHIMQLLIDDMERGTQDHHELQYPESVGKP